MALPLERGRHAHLLCQQTHLWLGHLAERETDAGQRCTPEPEQKVALVLDAVAAPEQRETAFALLDAGIVAGRKKGRAERLHALQQRIELEVVVAEHAGARRPAAPVLVHEVVDHHAPEGLLVVGHVEGEAELGGHVAGIVEVVWRAAALADLRRHLAVEPHRDAHHLMPLAVQQRGDHRAVDAARHRHDHAAGVGERFERSGVDVGGAGGGALLHYMPRRY